MTSEVIHLTDRADDAAQTSRFAFESYDDLMRRAISDSDAFAALYTKTVDEIMQFFRRRVFDIELSAEQRDRLGLVPFPSREWRGSYFCGAGAAGAAFAEDLRMVESTF